MAFRFCSVLALALALAAVVPAQEEADLAELKQRLTALEAELDSVRAQIVRAQAQEEKSLAVTGATEPLLTLSLRWNTWFHHQEFPAQATNFKVPKGEEVEVLAPALFGRVLARHDDVTGYLLRSAFFEADIAAVPILSDPQREAELESEELAKTPGQRLEERLRFTRKVSKARASRLEEQRERTRRAAAVQKREAATRERAAAYRSLAEETSRRGGILARYGEAHGRRIIEHEIWIGMTSEMVLASLGKPSETIRNVAADGVREQWIYSDRILRFTGGVLTSWQE